MLLLVVTTLGSFFVQWAVPDALTGSDPYFHIRQAWLMRQGLGDPSQWFALSTFTAMPTDLEYGFHALLIPFTSGDLIVGAKLAAVSGMTLYALACWWVLARLGVAAPALWTGAGLVMSPVFFHVMTQLRPLLVTTSLLLIGLYGLIARRRWLVGSTVALWTWLHHGYPLLLAAIGLHVLLQLAQRRTLDWRLLGWTLAGWLAGLATHPAPWSYVRLLGMHYAAHAQASLFGSTLPFATELDRWPAGMQNATAMIVLYATNAVWLWRRRRAQPQPRGASDAGVFLMLVLTLVWAMALRHLRFVGYLVPVTCLASAYCWQEPLRLAGWQHQRLFKRLRRRGAVRSRLVASLVGQPSLLAGLIVLTLLLGRAVYALRISASVSLSQSVLFEEPHRLGRWLGASVPPQSVVIQNRWDLFPWLFFHDYDSRFLNGFDPIDSYLAHPRSFWRWHHLVYEARWCDRETCPAASPVPDDLPAAVSHWLWETWEADYVALYAPWSHPGFQALLEDRRFFEPVFRAPRSAVYRLRLPDPRNARHPASIARAHPNPAP